MMSYRMTLPDTPKPIQRQYTDLRGVDFSSIPSRVALHRSPDAKNVYKNYASQAGQAIETRPGIAYLGMLQGDTGTEIYGIHIFEGSAVKALVHIDTKLYVWDSFPSAVTQSSHYTVLDVVMNAAVSSGVMFGGSLYIADGANYYVYDGEEINPVYNNAFIPTTSIGAAPDGSERKTHQAVNFLSDKRKNDFIADGTSADYYLDSANVDDITQVVVNGEIKTITMHYTIDTTAGKITFTSGNIPAKGADVTIEYKKVTQGYAAHINGCTLLKVFEGRVFASGNDDYKGVLFHSALDNATYFPDNRWYDDGEDNIGIKAIISASDRIICVKEHKGTGVKAYYHLSTFDEKDGAIYPIYETEIHLGAIAGGVNFRDAVVYLSKQGLERVHIAENTQQLLHASTLVDTALTNENELNKARLEVWAGYLCVLADGKMYLADSRQMNGAEYEWYFWDNMGIKVDGVLSKAVCIKEYDGELYFGTQGGHLLTLAGTHDDSINEGVNVPSLIESYWTTPLDVFNTLTRLKTTQKRGAVAQIKRIPNSIIKIAVSTDKQSWTEIHKSATAGFNYGRINYANWNYGTSARGFIVFKVKKRKVKHFSLKFYSDAIDKPFGLYEATVEYIIGNYVKN